MTKWLAAAFGLLVLGAAGAIGTGLIDINSLGAVASKGDKPAKSRVVRPATVTVVHPVMHDFRETVLITGSLVPRQEVLIAPQIEGQRIRKLLVEEGDRVRKGQVLALLETENLKAKMAQNAASIARAEASMARARSNILDAQAQLEEADSALKRAKPLRRQGAVSQSTLDQRQAAASSARARVAVARNDLSVAESDKARALAERVELQWQIDSAEIISPVDGLVMRRDAKIGAIASGSGMAMFRIIENGEIELAGELTVDDLARVKAGQKARIKLEGVGRFDGTVRLVSPEVDAKTRLGTARVLIGDKPGLMVGAFARGRIATANSEGLAVPASAVMRDNDGTYLHVVADGAVRTRRIDTGLAGEGLVEVKSGLAETDQVVAKAGTFLRDGDAVTPVLQEVQARYTEVR